MPAMATRTVGFSHHNIKNTKQKSECEEECEWFGFHIPLDKTKKRDNS